MHEPILSGTTDPPCRRSLTLATPQKSFLFLLEEKIVCCNYTLCANLFHTRGARGSSGLNRTLGFRAPRPLPSVAGAKTKNFPSLILDFRRGVWGEPTKNGKEIFGFASPLQTTK
ncbi:TPA: hypothetical protein DCP81_03305 [Candidatus Azambacteria bacterium]|nr:hypothetical protein [Candidatus Azambacteria bacterium]